MQYTEQTIAEVSVYFNYLLKKQNSQRKIWIYRDTDENFQNDIMSVFNEFKSERGGGGRKKNRRKKCFGKKKY